MLRKILVPLDTSDFTQAATRMAIAIADREQAVVREPVTLVGQGIVDLDQLPKGRFANLVPRDNVLTEARAKVQELMETFRREGEAHGLPTTQMETLETEGSPFRCIIRESVFCDLIVMGERCSFPPVHHDYLTMHHLYHEASRPVIITEQGFQRVERVVMAMDGTAPSSRMMYNYVHLQPFPRAQVVLAYSGEEEGRYKLTEYFQRVKRYLESYHLDVKTVALPGDLEGEIAGCVTREGASVLALGVHREQFLERLSDPFGIRQNFARRLLKSMSASLFIVH